MLNAKENREIWMRHSVEHRELLEKRAAETIERYRKGSARVKFTDKNGKPIRDVKAKITQVTHDFKYGANIFMLDEFTTAENNLKYRENFKKYFNLATIPFYWDALEPEEGNLRYCKDSKKIYRRPAPDLCLEYCDENGIDAKLHCLVYENFMPDWMPKSDMAAMERLYEKRFMEIAERYVGRLIEFEVFNELLIEKNWNKQSVISERRDIIDWAFKLARKYFPNEVLVANEGNPLVTTAVQDYRDAYFMMLEGALLRGVTIDKIGIQHHEFCCATCTSAEEYEKRVKEGSVMFNPFDLFKGLDIFSELGLPLELTEITIPTFGETEEDEELQADLLETLYTVYFGHPAVDTIVYWNLVDSYAYHNEEINWNENNCRGGLFRRDLTPKKAADRILELFGKKWHTDLEIFTDNNGAVEFRGFYGSYEAEIDGKVYKFELHRNQNSEKEIII